MQAISIHPLKGGPPLRIKQWRIFDGCFTAGLFLYILGRACAGRSPVPGVQVAATWGALLFILPAVAALAAGVAALFTGDRALLWDLGLRACCLRLAAAFLLACALFFHCLVPLHGTGPRFLPTLLDKWTHAGRGSAVTWAYADVGPEAAAWLNGLRMTSLLPIGPHPFAAPDPGLKAPRSCEISLRVDGAARCTSTLRLDFYTPRFVAVTYIPSPMLHGRAPPPTLYYLMAPVDLASLPGPLAS